MFLKTSKKDRKVQPKMRLQDNFATDLIVEHKKINSKKKCQIEQIKQTQFST